MPKRCRKQIAVCAAAALAVAACGLQEGVDCVTPNVELDCLVALDNTVSMARYMAGLAEQLTTALAGIVNTFPLSRFGLASFNDMPTQCTQNGGMYSWHNYCTRLEVPLTPDLGMLDEQLQVVTSDSMHGGGFVPEDSLGVMAQQSANPRVGWRRQPLGPHSILKRIMVVVTDASYRYPHDYTLPQDCIVRDNDGDGDYECGVENYYTEEQAARLIKRAGVIPIVATLTDNRQEYEDFFSRFNIQGYTLEMSATDASKLTGVIRDSIGDIACNEPAPTPAAETTSKTYPVTEVAPTTELAMTEEKPTMEAGTSTVKVSNNYTDWTQFPAKPEEPAEPNDSGDDEDQASKPNAPPHDSGTKMEVTPTSGSNKKLVIGAAVAGVAAAVVAAVAGTLAYRRSSSSPNAPDRRFDFETEQQTPRGTERDIEAEADLAAFH